MSSLKFPNSHRSSEILVSTTSPALNIINGRPPSSLSAARLDWTQLCFQYLEKILAAKKDEKKGWIGF